jgi:hypothetical protein
MHRRLGKRYEKGYGKRYEKDCEKRLSKDDGINNQTISVLK